MSKRRAKTYAKTALLAGAAIVATVIVDTMWNYSGNNAEAQLSTSQVRIR